VVPLVAAGRILIGLEAVPENVINAINSDSKLRIVGAQLQRSPECWVSLAKAPITSPKEIEGKRLGVILSGEHTAQVFMRFNGVDTSKVTLVPIQYDPAPLAAGEVDALWGYVSNQPVSLELRGYPAYTMPLADFGFNRMQDVLFVSEETLADEKKRALVKRFLSASADGWTLALSHPDEAVSEIIRLFGLSLGLTADEQARILAVMAPYFTRQENPGRSQFWMGESLIGDTITSLGRIGVRVDQSMFTNDLLA
jgi:ABC-type nitrate/sulfonate/bicarbonate transport system substrate-binding protein